MSEKNVTPNSKASAKGPDRDARMIKGQDNPITADSLDPNFSQKAAQSWFDGVAKSTSGVDIKD